MESHRHRWDAGYSSGSRKPIAKLDAMEASTPFTLRIATAVDAPTISALIAASVRALHTRDHTASQIEQSLATVFTIDSQLLADGTYFLAYAPDGQLAGCGGWSFRKTLYGGDRQMNASQLHGIEAAGKLEPKTDAAKIRAIFVHPAFARRGLGSLILATAESAAQAAGFTRFEMGSTLTGAALYRLRGYAELDRLQVPVGPRETIEVIRMCKFT
jgi:GNAT superfamily N-acetyltransferase